MPYKISVIMLTYNRENVVGNMVESILTQTFENFEFIIVDNGSTDNSGKIVDEYAIKDSRIHVIHRERGNIGSGRNSGLKVAQGEYITFVDDDDTCEPDFLDFLLNLATKNDAEISICASTKWENDKTTLVGIADEPIVMTAQISIIELLWRKRYNNGFPTKLFKHSMFAGLLFPETGMYDDIYLMYKVLANATKVVSSGIPKYNVIRHESNNSIATTKHTNITACYLNDYLSIYHERTIWLCEKFPLNCDYWCYFNWSFQISMVEKIIKYNLSDCNAHLFEMRSELLANSQKFLTNPYILDFEKCWMEKYILKEKF